METPSRNIHGRLKLSLVVIYCLLFIIASRLFYLQITQMLTLWDRGQRNCLRYQKIESPRGNILDCSGKLIATNKPITDVYWQGTGSKQISDQQEKELFLLNKILSHEMDRDEIQIAERRGKRILIAHDITFEQLSCLLEQCPQRYNLDLETRFKRYYPYNTWASHVVGYLSSISEEREGKMGIEKVLEEQLHGSPGERIYTINSFGKYLGHQEIKPANAGKDIHTTIDIELQQFAEEAFPAEDSGVFVIMDPEDGSIKALVSRPNFDPNIFLKPMDNQQWQLLQEKKPFLNRACNACYPPASLFKLVTMAAGLEQGLISPNNTVYCSGHVIFANRPYHCSKQEGHGHLTMQEALIQSCNIPFFDIGKKIKIDVLAQYAQKFGLGVKTNVLFTEKTGLVPTSQWKRQVKREPWWPGETLSAAIGQSYLLVTPMQILCMFSSICQGHLVKPRILSSEPIEQKPLELSHSTIDFLKKSLRSVSQRGTGRALSYIPDMTIYAKTGTAQTSDLSKRDMGKQFVEHAWFAAHFQYKDHKPLSLVILMENAGSSRIAVEVARLFLTNYRLYLLNSYKEISQ